MNQFLFNMLQSAQPMPAYPETPATSSIDQMLENFKALLSGPGESFLIVMGIAAILPAIICLLIAYFASRNHEGSGKSVLGLIGVSLVMCVPIVSLVMVFIWAFGEKTKSDPTFRNWARLLLISELYVIIFSITYVVGNILVLNGML